MTVRARGTSYRQTAVQAIGEDVAPLATVRPLEDPYQGLDDAPAVTAPLEACKHGAPAGTSCIYCQNESAFAQVPHAIEHAGEKELAELLRRLMSEARANWNRDSKAWRGNWDKYLAWHLARRLIDADGITVNVTD